MSKQLIVVAFLSSAVVLAAGCKSKSGSVTADKDVIDALVPDGGKDAADGTVIPVDVKDVAEDQGFEFHTKDDHTPDVTGDVSLDLPDGSTPDQHTDTPADVWAPDPCKSHEDCKGEGMCVELSPGSGKFVCAPFCLEECPLDWECKSVYVDGPDPTSLCFPPTETLCSACQQDKECLFAGALCIKSTGAVGYCGKLCDMEKPDCPDSFACAMATGPNGQDLAPQCMPKEGSCCVAGKLKSCDDQNPCTADFCDASFGCKHKSIDGLCTGDQPCTNYKCINGACMGIPITIDYTLDGVDDDCDGQVDEDWILNMNAPLYSFSSSTGVVSGGGITIKGSISTPPLSGTASGGDLVVTPVTTKVVDPQQ
jgi:hypothetical protein